MAKKNSIWVGEEAYKYLLTVSIMQREGERPDVEKLEKSWRRKLLIVGVNNMVQLTDGDIGGADSVGLWCSWTIQDMKRFLKRKGLKWQTGKTVEYVAI